MLVDKIIFFIMTIIFISVNLFDKFKECYKKSRNKTSLTNVIQPEATVTSKTKKRFNMLKFVLYFLLRSVSLTSFFAFLQVKIIVLGHTAVVL